MTTPARYEPLKPTAAVSRAEISQATAIEQSRAVAEVQAAVFVAQQRPRNKVLAVEEMRDATAQMAVASNAYFRYARGGEQITGVSIHLARELARCWGNIDYGLKELRRDDLKGESEMLAHAWDMQTNARASTTFIVPHVRDTKKGPKQLTETRDIYENNANAGARRLREQVLAVLPKWFVEEAKSNCDATLENGGGKPLAHRITDAVYGFGQIGVTQAQLEAKLGRGINEWTGHDLGQLSVIYNSIQRGETRVDDEFATTDPGADGVSAEDITQADRKRREPSARTAPEPDSKPATPTADQTAQAPAPEPKPQPEGTPEAAPTDQQVKELQAALRGEGLRSSRQQVEYLRKQFNRPISAIFDLSGKECAELTHFLMTAPKDQAAPPEDSAQLPIDGADEANR